jgi:hypothetical protein
MKKNIILFALPLMMLCGCGTNNSDKDNSVGYTQTNDQENVLHRLPELYVQDTFRLGGNTYSWVIDRKPCDSLDVVTDEMGNKYVDNLLSVSVKKNSQPLFSRTFKKKDFRHHLDAEFMSQSILDGCRFIEVHEGMVIFSLAVSYPDSDMSRPFKLNIGPDGSHLIVKDDTMEDEYSTDSQSSDGV